MGFLRDLFKKKEGKGPSTSTETEAAVEKQEPTTRTRSLLLDKKQHFHSLDGVTIHLLLNAQFAPAGIRAWRATAGRSFGNSGTAGDIDLGMFGVNPAMDAFKAGEIAQNLSIECVSCH